ncbi:MAG TPA: response regulator, partial [bacterium]|nr:response regulator [bacterium]
TFANQTGGTGLGLAICRALVQEHGGEVWVETEVNKGSTFSFTLPAPETTASEAVAAMIAATGHVEGSPRVMVVDDDRDVATLIRMYLEQEGFEVIQAAGGREALEIARREKLDAITLDLNMPEVSGFDVVKALKDDTRTKDVPVIFVSVSNAEEATPPGTSAASLSFADWVTKPIDPARLINAVKRHAQRRAGRPNILVVDDDPDIQKLLGIILAREGFEVENASNGEEALRRVAARKPDLIILDLVMPALDGFAVVKRLREQKSTRRVPVLILSVKDLSDDERRILETGTTKFLTKSYASREALLREVVDLLNGAIRASDDKPTSSRPGLKGTT